MEVERPRYLNQLIDKKDNGRVKIITGVRRCGKSYLLFELYRKYLLSIGIPEAASKMNLKSPSVRDHLQTSGNGDSIQDLLLRPSGLLTAGDTILQETQ